MNRREQLKAAGLRGGADFTDSCLTSQIPGSVIDINSLRLSFCKGCINDICIHYRSYLLYIFDPLAQKVSSLALDSNPLH